MKQTHSAPVEFSCHAPNATAVFVAGTFSDLAPDATPLQPQANGKWTGTLQPPTGRHEYKFVVDRQWGCDHQRLRHDEPRIGSELSMDRWASDRGSGKLPKTMINGETGDM